MASRKTVVKGLRASKEFFDKCDALAKSQGIDRNKLIVGLVERKFGEFKWCECANLDGDIKYVFSKVKK